ncbi:hypothetical protein TWF730_010372 [Orbilia blumenaviensis]|uniref:Uncharacterized protein n=1 Tax=Orbilia blumenaviensis TaxID=1796055 RepID=A0AAV9USK4_9PEZI
MDYEAPPPAGTRFTVDLDDTPPPRDEIEAAAAEEERNKRLTAALTNGLIGDIAERTVSPSSIPLAPTLDPSSLSSPSSSSITGFPAHTKRQRLSAFRLQRGSAGAASAAAASRNRYDSAPPRFSTTTTTNTTATATSAHGGRIDEMSSIRAENAQRVAGMSSEERDAERQELMDSLSPELLQMFLKRASLDDEVETSRPPVRTAEPIKESAPTTTTTTTTTATTTTAAPAATVEPSSPATSPLPTDTPTQPNQPAHLENIPSTAFPPSVKVHFPAPPPPTTDPDPDPSSPTFLTHLHQKYFPNLPTDPQKLAWMQPLSSTKDEEDPLYSPSLTSILPSSIRFDFKGRLLPPRKSRAVPAHLGLHHHADSPLSAGYTIPELSHLARSSFPAQRCMAFQTLGRVLYRLGVGAYSNPDQEGEAELKNPTTTTSLPSSTEESIKEEVEEEDARAQKESSRRINTPLEQSLWRCIHEGRVLESLQEAGSGGRNGEGSSHLGVKNYALEALWLWQKGGGERWKAD